MMYEIRPLIFEYNGNTLPIRRPTIGINSNSCTSNSKVNDVTFSNSLKNPLHPDSKNSNILIPFKLHASKVCPTPHASNIQLFYILTARIGRNE